MLRDTSPTRLLFEVWSDVLGVKQNSPILYNMIVGTESRIHLSGVYEVDELDDYFPEKLWMGNKQMFHISDLW